MKCPNCGTELGGKRYCPTCNVESSAEGITQGEFPQKRPNRLLALLTSGMFWMILVCVAVVVAAQFIVE